MENNILTTKEWLEKEQLNNPLVEGTHPCDDLFPGYKCSTVMERYANYKTQELQAKIFEFRNEKIKCDWIEMPYRYNQDFLKEYDEFFNITTARDGKT